MLQFTKKLFVGILIFITGFITSILLSKNDTFKIKTVPNFVLSTQNNYIKMSGALHALNYQPVTSLVIVDASCDLKKSQCDVFYSILNDTHLSMAKNSYDIKSIDNGVIVAVDDVSACINKILEIDTKARTVIFKDSKKSNEEACSGVPSLELSELKTFYPSIGQWKK